MATPRRSCTMTRSCAPRGCATVPLCASPAAFCNVAGTCATVTVTVACARPAIAVTRTEPLATAVIVAPAPAAAVRVAADAETVTDGELEDHATPTPCIG